MFSETEFNKLLEKQKILGKEDRKKRKVLTFDKNITEKNRQKK